jgi:hypothetical protein
MTFVRSLLRRTTFRAVRRAVWVCLALLLFLPASVSAQTEPSPSDENENPQSARLNDTFEPTPPSASLTGVGLASATTSATCDFRDLTQCLKDIGHDQIGLWTSPSRVKRKDALWLVPFAAVTVIAFRIDGDTSQDIGFNPTRLRVSNDISTALGGYSPLGFGFALWSIGDLTHHDRVAETGKLGVEAITDAFLVDEAMKLATNRDRPADNALEPGAFWEHGTKGMAYSSFPSGHAITTWALARVVAEEYPNKWARLGAYSVAALVSVARVTGQNHFPSDVVVGGTLGYLIGGYVYRRHAFAGRGVITSVAPFANQASHTYGVTLELQP